MNSVFGRAFDRDTAWFWGVGTTVVALAVTSLLLLLLRSKACELFSTGIFIHDAVAPVLFIHPNLQRHFLLNSGLVVLVACLCTDAFV